jgi:hypothetical protein
MFFLLKEVSLCRANPNVPQPNKIKCCPSNKFKLKQDATEGLSLTMLQSELPAAGGDAGIAKDFLTGDVSSFAVSRYIHCKAFNIVKFFCEADARRTP